jgi:2-dehydro-3-deoxyphosphooctonate aldolase (KDO 8-P synthase)
MKEEDMLDTNFIIAGPCVLETTDMCIEIAKYCKSICDDHGFKYIFKASFDKANRTSITSFRGPGLKRSINTFIEIRNHVDLITTDIHEPCQAAEIAPFVDIIQIPAFLCRQTDLLVAAGETGKIVNIKKAQFLSADKMEHAIRKVYHTGNKNVMLTERGSMMGMSDLVVDFRNIHKLKQLGCPVIMDVTHACQTYQQTNGITGGNRVYGPLFAQCAKIFGANGIFAEVHPNPDNALSDSANTMNFEMFESMVKKISKL